MSTTTTTTKQVVDLEQSSGFADGSYFLVHDGTGLKKLTGSDLKANLFENNAGTHNSIYRGKNLGTTVTDEQYAAISAGTFNDLYLGDYWTINGTKYVIAGFNYYKNVGDSGFTANHVTLVTAKNMYGANMNDTNTAVGAYSLSQMNTENLTQARDKIATDFGSHLASHKIILPNAINDSGVETGYEWVNSTVELLTEIMVYGTPIKSTIPKNYLCEKFQLPLFAVHPESVNTRETYWLRDVQSKTAFCYVHLNGSAAASAASYPIGVRPYFSIS